MSELRENFDHFDTDDDGTIDFDEFRRLLAGLDAGMSDEEMKIGFEAIDRDGNGRVDFGEFQAWWDAR